MTLDMLLDVVLDTIKDALMILPILFIAYFLMEMMEDMAEDKLRGALRRAGKFGPLLGALFGVVPECGFAAAAGGFFAGRVISAGTVLAVFLSTSDELIPIFLGEGTREIGTLILVLGLKVTWGIAAGYAVDCFWRRSRDGSAIHSICEEEHCGCDDEGHGGVLGWLRSAAIHTGKIMIWIVLTSLVLGMLVEWLGEDRVGTIIPNVPVLGELVTGLLGLIPNCAGSVLIAELYLGGVISGGAMLSGLLVSSGTGLLVLARMNRDRKETLRLLLILYAAGVIGGCALGWLI